jgi:hypothetical protein
MSTVRSNGAEKGDKILSREALLHSLLRQDVQLRQIEDDIFSVGSERYDSAALNSSMYSMRADV